jgi:hypothetical protein
LSSTDNPPPPPSSLPPPPPTSRSGCLTALMVIFGIIMLLPGLCALLFGGISVVDEGRIEAAIAPLVFLGLVAGAAGVALIWGAIRGRKG